MASHLLFIPETKSWGIKPNSKEIPIRCGPDNPNRGPNPMPSLGAPEGAKPSSLLVGN